MPSLTTTHFKHLPFPLCDDLCLALHLAVQFAGDLSTFEVCSKLVRGKLKGFVCMLAATEDMKKPVMWHRHQYSLYELPPFRERKKKMHQSNKKKKDCTASAMAYLCVPAVLEVANQFYIARSIRLQLPQRVILLSQWETEAED